MRAIWLLPIPCFVGAASFLPPPRALTDPVEAVRVFGGTTAHAGIHAIRIDCVEKRGDRESPATHRTVRVSVAGQIQDVACGAFGSVEIPVLLPGGDAPVEVVARSVGLRFRPRLVLAEGRVAVPPAQTRAAQIVRSARLEGTAIGASFEAYLTGGAVPVDGVGHVFLRARAASAPLRHLDCSGDGHPLTFPVQEIIQRAMNRSRVRSEGIGARTQLDHKFCTPRGYLLSVMPQADVASFVLTRAEGDLADWSFRAAIPVREAPSVTATVTSDGKRLSAEIASARGVPRVHVRIDDDWGRRQATWLTLSPPPALDWQGRSTEEQRRRQPFPNKTHATLVLPVAFDLAKNPVLVVGESDDAGPGSQAIALEATPDDTVGLEPAWLRRDPASDLRITPTVLWLDGMPEAIVAHAARGRRARALTYAGYGAAALGQLVVGLLWRARRTRSALAAAS